MTVIAWSLAVICALIYVFVLLIWKENSRLRGDLDWMDKRNEWLHGQLEDSRAVIDMYRATEAS